MELPSTSNDRPTGRYVAIKLDGAFGSRTLDLLQDSTITSVALQHLVDVLPTSVIRQCAAAVSQMERLQTLHLNCLEEDPFGTWDSDSDADEEDEEESLDGDSGSFEEETAEDQESPACNLLFSQRDTFPQRILSSITIQNIVRLEELVISGGNLDGIGIFLASPCASKLEALTLTVHSMSQDTAKELALGLEQNQSIKYLALRAPLPQSNWDGLPLLADSLHDNTNIQTLVLGSPLQQGCPLVNNANLILSALRCNSILTSLTIDSFLERDHGPWLQGMLVLNSTLQSLSLCLEQCLLAQEEHFRRLLSSGLSSNTSLHSLWLSSTDERGQPDDLSAIFRALKSRPAESQLKKLYLTFMPMTAESVDSLCQWLKHPECRLMSLEMELTQPDHFPHIVGAIKKSTHLKRLLLDAHVLGADYRDYLKLFELPNLTHIGDLSIDRAMAACDSEEDQKEFKQRLVRAVQRNNSIVYVDWGDSLDDIELRGAVDKQCIQNMSIQASGLPAALLPHATAAIKKRCEAHGEPTVGHFARALYPLLSSRPEPELLLRAKGIIMKEQAQQKQATLSAKSNTMEMEQVTPDISPGLVRSGAGVVVPELDGVNQASPALAPEVLPAHENTPTSGE